MLEKTMIVSSLVGLAAAITAHAGDTHDSHGSAGAAGTEHMSAAALFQRLDTNDDGLLSRDEAAADPRISSLYDSLDTSPTLEGHERRTRPDGITRAQFKAGMTAQQSGSGSFGPAVSGGEKYLVYPDGSREKVNETDTARDR